MKRVCAWVGLGLVGACAEPATFEELDPAIKEASAAGTNLNVVAQIGLVTDGTLGMTQVGDLVGTIAGGVQSNLPGPTAETQHLQLQLHFDSTDRLGNEGFVDFGTIRFPMSELRSAKLENLAGTELLELADSVSPSEASDIAINYCSDPQNFQINPRWCATVAEGFGL